jgi:hypothetical protein
VKTSLSLGESVYLHSNITLGKGHTYIRNNSKTQLLVGCVTFRLAHPMMVEPGDYRKSGFQGVLANIDNRMFLVRDDVARLCSNQDHDRQEVPTTPCLH